MRCLILGLLGYDLIDLLLKLVYFAVAFTRWPVVLSKFRQIILVIGSIEVQCRVQIFILSFKTTVR
jgi:hypothetical protein